MGTFRIGSALVLILLLATPVCAASWPWLLRSVGEPAVVRAKGPCVEDTLSCVYQDCVVAHEVEACSQSVTSAAWEIVCFTPDQGVGLNLEGTESGCKPPGSYVPLPSGLPP